MSLRQPILYAEEMWRRQRFFVLLLLGLGVVASVTTLVGNHGRLDSTSGVFLIYVPAGLLFGGALLLYRYRNYVQVTDTGLKVSNLLRSVVIDWDQIRAARVQPLERHFVDGRKRLAPPVAKDLMKKDALFVRLKGDEIQLAEWRRRLGNRLVADDTVAVPIPDPNALAWEVSARLPEKMGMNLGGGKRRRRRAR